MIRYLLLFFPLCLHAQSIADYLSAPFPTELTTDKQGFSMAWVFNKLEAEIFIMQKALI